MRVEFITNKIFNSRTYVLSSEGETEVWLVDCGDVAKIYDLIGESTIKGVLLTHTHSDHIYGLMDLLERFPNVKVYTNEYGVKALQSPKLNISRYHTEYGDIVIDKPGNIHVLYEGNRINVLGRDVSVYETPGHDPSCLTFKMEDMLFTGDAYISGVKVFTGFPHSNRQQAQDSVARILKLALNCKILPGHTLMPGAGIYSSKYI